MRYDPCKKIESLGIYHIASPEMIGDRQNIEPDKTIIRLIEG